ncbi:MAG TPA: NAD(P)H-hydrate dehydratase, partial [Candidatus Rubrimentiphilum sp.]|nr:NAD(P)H-hydrate dehydratase [Candidatus Rubrimentiphilum sp.]
AFAGKGNNGGDALAALAELPRDSERIAYVENSPSPPAARRDAEERAKQNGVLIRGFPKSLTQARTALESCTLAFDGMLGIGARLPVPAIYRDPIAALNEGTVPVLAIDVPTGVNAGDGAVSDPAVQATLTVTLAAPKLGLLLEPARSYCGELWIGDIGMPDAILQAQSGEYASLDFSEFFRLLPKRDADSDKRKAGAPLIIAGSQQFPGAAVLCALGAARAGAGYVTVATPQSAVAPLHAHLIEQVVVELNSADDALDVAKRCGSIGIGPGLGLDDATGELVRDIVRRAELPIVADASALFHFAKNLEMLRGKQIVLTPHEGEFARLSGKGTIKPGDRVARLREFVDRTGVTTLLKGPSTLIYDGNVMHINPTGTPLLATAGTGDVLTGMIATLLSQGLGVTDAARAAAYWHGLAAHVAAQGRAIGVIARDIADNLGRTISLWRSEADVPGLTRVF